MVKMPDSDEPDMDDPDHLSHQGANYDGNVVMEHSGTYRARRLQGAQRMTMIERAARAIP